jgi:hypothetical protein
MSKTPKTIFTNRSALRIKEQKGNRDICLSFVTANRNGHGYLSYQTFPKKEKILHQQRAESAIYA